MITFDNTRFTYNGQRFVLDGIDLHVRPGEYVAILGGNGSGKSTLAKHMNALLVPDEGTVTVDGRSTVDPDALYLIRSTAGMVFQNPDDQLVATLVENDVAFGPENLGLPADDLRERVTEALHTVGLQGFELRETAQLSGGQKQRVAIAGVLAMRPRVLILDEASAMLDPRGRTGLLRVMEQLHQAGMTVVTITHSMEEAALADRVLILDDGRVVREGAPADVLTDAAALTERGLTVPFATELSRCLQQAGVPVGTHLHDNDLEEELCALISSR
ncbi:MAG: energy-coupling factor transporter ATPase [Coriobacteriia bacterium]|nr:energy-coupling factor transporter ATPase [Coriobacteriia bacterium]